MHVSRVTPWRVVVAAAYAAGQMPLSRDEIAAAWAAARREESVLTGVPAAFARPLASLLEDSSDSDVFVVGRRLVGPS